MPTRQIRTVEPHLDSDILRIIEKKSSPNHPITSSELLLALRKLGYGGSGRSLRDHLSHLCGLNSLLRAVGRNGRIGYLTQKMISEWEAGKFENRRIHSEDLRRVIQDWVLSLPYVNRTDAIPRFHFGPGLYSVFDGGRLAVENDVIFRDLSNHLDHQLLNRWDDLKDAARRFEKQRAGLDARIRMQVVDVFGLNILNRWDTSCVNEQLLKRVESAIFAQAENRDKDFHKYANFDSELVDKPNFFEYYLDHVEAVKVAKQNLPSNAELIEKRIELDEKVSSLMQIDTSTIEKAEKLIKAVKKFEDEGILILRQLEELVRLPTFPGKCRYLSV